MVGAFVAAATPASAQERDAKLGVYFLDRVLRHVTQSRDGHR